jgi:hypothetical protein
MPFNYGLSPQAQASLNYSRFSPTAGATGFNLGSGENLSSLSEMINAMTRTGQSAALGARIPGGTALEEQSSANIRSELGGELPADVLANLRQQAAERGVAIGSPASPNSNAAYLRAIGLTSLDLQNQGQQHLTAAEGRNPAAPIFDPTSQLITPYQAGTLDLEQQRLQQELRLSQQRLAQQAAFGGGRGGGGQPERETGLDYVRQPFASDRMVNPPALLSPYAMTGPTGSSLYETDPTQAWWNSINYSPGRGGFPGSGSTYFGPPATQTGSTGADFDQMFAEMFPGAADSYISPDAFYGPEQ